MLRVKGALDPCRLKPFPCDGYVDNDALCMAVSRGMQLCDNESLAASVDWAARCDACEESSTVWSLLVIPLHKITRSAQVLITTTLCF